MTLIAHAKNIGLDIRTESYAVMHAQKLKRIIQIIVYFLLFTGSSGQIKLWPLHCLLCIASLQRRYFRNARDM